MSESESEGGSEGGRRGGRRVRRGKSKNPTQECGEKRETSPPS